MKKTALILSFLLTGFVFFAAGILWEGRARADTFSMETSPVFTAFASHEDGAPKGQININAATARELADLPGVGPVLAQRVIEYREAAGPFTAPEDLLDVKGIGEATLARLLPHVTAGD